MASRLFLGDIRTCFREVLAVWAVLTTSAIILALVASPLAYGITVHESKVTSE